MMAGKIQYHKFNLTYMYLYIWLMFSRPYSDRFITVTRWNIAIMFKRNFQVRTCLRNRPLQRLFRSFFSMIGTTLIMSQRNSKTRPSRWYLPTDSVVCPSDLVFFHISVHLCIFTITIKIQCKYHVIFCKLLKCQPWYICQVLFCKRLRWQTW